MPQYDVTDPRTGRLVKITLPTPPTPEILEKIFGVRKPSPVPAPQDPQMGIRERLGEAALRLGQDVGNFVEPGLRMLGMPASAVAGATDAALTGQDPIKGAGQGAMSAFSEPVMMSDVLRQRGVTKDMPMSVEFLGVPGETIRDTSTNFSADPLMFMPGASGARAARAAKAAAARAAAEAGVVIPGGIVSRVVKNAVAPAVDLTVVHKATPLGKLRTAMAKTVVPKLGMLAKDTDHVAIMIQNNAPEGADVSRLIDDVRASGDSITGRELSEIVARHTDEGNAALRDASEAYIAEQGLPKKDFAPKVETLSKANMAKVAKQYEELANAPYDPAVQSAYSALGKETRKQWDYLTNKVGLKMEPWTAEGQPYANSREMSKDIRDNKHLYFFQGGDFPEGNPLQTMDPDTGLSYNDMFRAVHDAFGHAKEGFQFGALGEENAFRAHARMFTREARRALATETKGQNSWVNFGPNSNLPVAERPYAEQKAALFPEALMTTNAGVNPLASPQAALHATGAAIGANVGSEVDPEHPVLGAVLGGVVGAGAVSALRNPRLLLREAGQIGGFGKSAFVDASGRGRLITAEDNLGEHVLYHGTRGDFKSFKPSTGGEFGPGVYFSPDPGAAAMAASRAVGQAGENVIPAVVEVKNPFHVTKQQWGAMTASKSPSQVQKELVKQGYDGIVGTGINGVEQQVVAFKPEQIKSALSGSNTGVDDAGLLDALFPSKDPYAKPMPHMAKEKVLDIVQSKGSDLSPETVSRLTDWLGTIKRRVSPSEVRAKALGIENEKAGRMVRRISEEKAVGEKLSGAPYGVSTARDEATRRAQYKQRVMEGILGRGFYTDSGEWILSAAGDDPALARKVTDNIAIVSPGNTVAGNSSMSMKGHNQAVSGGPVNAGRWPARQSKEIYQAYFGGTGARGLKRTPFGKNISAGGGYGEASDRSTHDIWDGEAFGYVNPDGTALRRGFSEAEHKWMDRQIDRIIKELNETKAGGFDDWDYGNTQAAAWTGAQLRAGKIAPGDAAKSYATYMPKSFALGSRETVPGRSTGHLPELIDAPYDVRREYNEGVDRVLYDEKGRDKVAQGYQMLTGKSLQDTPGIYEGNVNPGTQSPVFTGQIDAPEFGGSARTWDPATKALIEAREGSYGILTGQDAIAAHQLFESGAKFKNAAVIMLKGGGKAVTPELAKEILKTPGLDMNKMVPIASPEGIRLLGFGNTEDDIIAINKAAKEVNKRFGADPKLKPQMLRSQGIGPEGGGLYENNFSSPEGMAGQQYAKLIDNPRYPRMVERFDEFMPELAQGLRDHDRRFSTKYAMTIGKNFDNLRAAIAGEGWRGMQKLVKKLGLPTGAAGALVLIMHKAGVLTDAERNLLQKEAKAATAH